ncbi:MAG: ion transporter [Rhodobacteraceae bacterium]|nr:ion transporter [Paracoccaceae bacterium]
MTRKHVAAWLDLPQFRNGIMAVIIFNAFLLGVKTSDLLMAAAGLVIVVLDRICLGIFVIEIVLKVFAHRLAFFRDSWNLFDFVIVGIALVPAGQGFSVLRALRILRILRITTAAPRLRRVVEGFITALPGMGSVFLLMGIIFYIGAVMATNLFGNGCLQLAVAACTEQRHAEFIAWFGTLGRSLYSLFQIMTLESWSMGIVRPVLEVYPYAWAFFVPFIMITTFAVVNLLVGLIVNSMQDAHAEESTAATDAYRDEVMKRLEAIEKHLKARG